MRESDRLKIITPDVANATCRLGCAQLIDYTRSQHFQLVCGLVAAVEDGTQSRAQKAYDSVRKSFGHEPKCPGIEHYRKVYQPEQKPEGPKLPLSPAKNPPIKG